MRKTPRASGEIDWEQAARDYLRLLPPEHFMEATPQATQRKITLESFDLVQLRRPDMHVFNELLVQYPRNGRRKLGQVVPDNMVVLYEGEIHAEGSYELAKQPARPFWMLEYVSKHSKRKDYDDNMEKYEVELKVPYYLLFVPEEQEMTLYRHTRKKYVTVLPDKQGRVELRELELKMGLQEGWVRYWFRDELLPLPADLLRQLDESRKEVAQLRQQVQETEAEVQRLRAELERARRRAPRG